MCVILLSYLYADTLMCYLLIHNILCILYIIRNGQVGRNLAQ